MSDRLRARLDALRESGRKALVPFVTAGDPSPEATVPVLHALVAAGADVIELGVPFSDPMADGPVIQRSSERALASGVGMQAVLDFVREFRQRDRDTPVVLMGYLNPVDIRGAEPFARAAVDAGVDGVLLVDLPPEEADAFRPAFDAHGLALVPLAAPTTSPERLARVDGLSLAPGRADRRRSAGVPSGQSAAGSGSSSASERRSACMSGKRAAGSRSRHRRTRSFRDGEISGL